VNPARLTARRRIASSAVRSLSWSQGIDVGEGVGAPEGGELLDLQALARIPLEDHRVVAEEHPRAAQPGLAGARADLGLRRLGDRARRPVLRVALELEEDHGGARGGQQPARRQALDRADHRRELPLAQALQAVADHPRVAVDRLVLVVEAEPSQRPDDRRARRGGGERRRRRPAREGVGPRRQRRVVAQRGTGPVDDEDVARARRRRRDERDRHIRDDDESPESHCTSPSRADRPVLGPHPHTEEQHMTGRIRARALAAGVLAAGGVAVFAVGGSSAQQATQNVSVRLSEYNIGMPTRLKAGQTTFKFWDAGSFSHNFTIVAGPDKFGTANFNKNQTGTLSRDLKPGAYLAICTFRNGGHMRDGMVVTFTVGTQNPQTGEWSA
jgi:plastocyanin